MTEINTAQKNSTREVINMENSTASQPNVDTQTNNQELLRIKTGLPKHGTQRARAENPTTGELNPRGARRSSNEVKR